MKVKNGAPSGWMRSTLSSASSAILRFIKSMLSRNSPTTPSFTPINIGMTPMPSGSRRMNSSSEPGRRVGLMMPTTPRHVPGKLLGMNLLSPQMLFLRAREAVGFNDFLYIVGHLGVMGPVDYGLLSAAYGFFLNRSSTKHGTLVGSGFFEYLLALGHGCELEPKQRGVRM